MQGLDFLNSRRSLHWPNYDAFDLWDRYWLIVDVLCTFLFFFFQILLDDIPTFKCSHLLVFFSFHLIVWLLGSGGGLTCSHARLLSASLMGSTELCVHETEL